MSEEYIKLKLYSKFDKMATSKGDENLSTKSTESTVTEDNLDALDVSFNRATSVFDHLPVEEADDRIKTNFREYVKQKGYSKGITSLALLTANANQLHFVLMHPDAHLRTLETVFLVLSIVLQLISREKANQHREYIALYCTSITMSVTTHHPISIFKLQVIAGVMLIIEFNLNEWRDKDRFKICRRLDTVIMCIMFFVIVLNIFVVAFGGPGIDILPHDNKNGHHQWDPVFLMIFF